MTSAYLSRSKHVVAIAGATGNLGSLISKTILTDPYRDHFSRVFLLVRDPSSPAAQELKALGGELAQIDFDDATSLSKSLKGVDVLINVLGTTNHEAKDKVLTAVLTSDVLLYIPSEFGVDDRFNEFEHVEWDKKKHHVARARKEGGTKMKIVAIYVGLFLEHSFGPWYGFDTKKKVYTAVGSPDALVTYTSKKDIARSVAQVVVQSLSSPSKIPDDVRIAGAIASHAQVRDIISRESGDKIEIKSLGDPAAYKKELQEKSGPKENMPGYIRLLMAEGKLDFSKENYNELVNPGEKLWKWKSVEEYAKEVNGHPWIDV